jgi:steroid delta-isomerase-like uncharacterized protein
MQSTHPIAQQWIDAWNARDVERILACLTGDAVYEDITLGAVNRTPAETKQFVAVAWSAFPDLRFESTGAADLGDNMVLEWTMRGTHDGDFPGLPASGRSFEVRGVSVIELAGGKIRRVRDYWDFATALRQLGFMPEPART